MLTDLDETLRHQIPTTFDHVATSDHRAFDRIWFAAYDPDGGAALQLTMGSYPNMNVLDAGAMVIRGNIQHNVRASRTLRPDFSTSVGPFSVEVIEPFTHLRLRVAPGDRPLACELDWRALLPPEEEHPHFARVRGRVSEDYHRYDQVGELSGWVQTTEGGRLGIDRWWATRDHSWGVRPGVGGPEPVTGETPPAGTTGSLFAFLFFTTADLAGHVQVAERDSGRSYLTGLVRDRLASGGVGDDRHVLDASLDFELHPGTRRFRTADITVELDDGTSTTLAAEALGPSFAMTGLGYSGGWNDGQGLGLWRGTLVEESDVWDVSDPVTVVHADGTTAQPVHRIQPVRVRVGDSVGTGSLTFIVNGSLPRYGLG